jgi:deoxyribodipyrimidine photolyase-related protein
MAQAWLAKMFDPSDFAIAKQSSLIITFDQLSHSISCLNDCDKSTDVILMCEVWEEATHVRHHQKKIAFPFSAMRHFCKNLQEKGYTVHHTHLDDGGNAGSIYGKVSRALQKRPFDRIVVTHPG